MTEEETERVTMLWPKALKAQVKEAAGPRGTITDFAIAAVEQHLGQGPSLDDTARELNEARHQAQVFADKLVLGGDNDDRLQALMEVEFPDWIDTVGWPKAYADLVTRRRALEEPEPEVGGDEPYVDESRIVRVTPRDRRPDGMPVYVEDGEYVPDHGFDLAPEGIADPLPAPGASEPAADLQVPADAASPRNDLFARVMEKTGQDLSGLGLKTASEIHNHAYARDERGDLRCECGSWIDHSDPESPNGIFRKASGASESPVEPPAPEAAEPTCPNDQDALIDGECWTCGYVAPS